MLRSSPGPRTTGLQVPLTFRRPVNIYPHICNGFDRGASRFVWIYHTDFNAHPVSPGRSVSCAVGGTICNSRLMNPAGPVSVNMAPPCDAPHSLFTSDTLYISPPSPLVSLALLNIHTRSRRVTPKSLFAQSQHRLALPSVWREDSLCCRRLNMNLR